MTDDVKQAIVELTAKVMCSDVAHIMSKSRKNIDARHMAMYVIGSVATVGPSEIARYFGCNHSTVIHARQRLKGSFEADPILFSQYEYLLQQVSQMDVTEIKEQQNAELFRLYAELKHEAKRLKARIAALEDENKLLRAALPVKINRA